jgi:hypothetical protein
MLNELRSRLGELAARARNLELVLAEADPGGLPGLQLAKLLIDVDRAASRLGAHTDKLGAAKAAGNGRAAKGRASAAS